MCLVILRAIRSKTTWNTFPTSYFSGKNTWSNFETPRRNSHFLCVRPRSSELKRSKVTTFSVLWDTGPFGQRVSIFECCVTLPYVYYEFTHQFSPLISGLVVDPVIYISGITIHDPTVCLRDRLWWMPIQFRERWQAFPTFQSVVAKVLAWGGGCNVKFEHIPGLFCPIVVWMWDTTWDANRGTEHFLRLSLWLSAGMIRNRD